MSALIGANSSLVRTNSSCWKFRCVSSNTTFLAVGSSPHFSSSDCPFPTSNPLSAEAELKVGLSEPPSDVFPLCAHRLDFLGMLSFRLMQELKSYTFGSRSLDHSTALDDVLSSPTLYCGQVLLLLLLLLLVTILLQMEYAANFSCLGKSVCPSSPPAQLLGFSSDYI